MIIGVKTSPDRLSEVTVFSDGSVMHRIYASKASSVAFFNERGLVGEKRFRLKEEQAADHRRRFLALRPPVLTEDVEELYPKGCGKIFDATPSASIVYEADGKAGRTLVNKDCGTRSAEAVRREIAALHDEIIALGR